MKTSFLCLKVHPHYVIWLDWVRLHKGPDLNYVIQKKWNFRGPTHLFDCHFTSLTTYPPSVMHCHLHLSLTTSGVLQQLTSVVWSLTAKTAVLKSKVNKLLYKDKESLLKQNEVGRSFAKQCNTHWEVFNVFWQERPKLNFAHLPTSCSPRKKKKSKQTKEIVSAFLL